MTERKEKPITVRLSPTYARLLMLNADGWMDAGACEGGLEPDERLALLSTCTQIQRQLTRRKLQSSTDGEDVRDKEGKL